MIFDAAGVTSQHVVLLKKPNTAFKGSGELLAVDSASNGSVTLRRLGANLNQGQPPAPAAGLSGVEFVIATLDPQTEEASFDLNRRYSIDPNIAGRTPADVYDLRDLRQACVLSVLAQRYAAETRGNQGDFALKLAQVKQELTEVLARIQLRWGTSGADQQFDQLVHDTHCAMNSFGCQRGIAVAGNRFGSYCQLATLH